MTFEQFPLPGYTLTVEDETFAAGGFIRQLRNSGSDGYRTFSLTVFTYETRDEPAKAALDLVKRGCTGSSLDKVKQLSLSRTVGEAARACGQTYSDGSGRQVELSIAYRTVLIHFFVQFDPGKVEDDDVLEVLTGLAELQVAIIDQNAPPGPTMTVTTGTPKFQFNTPATLVPAVAGKPYNLPPFSFCDPPTIGFTTQCPPPGTTARNPSGGSPPYHFQLGTVGGFPPFGMYLGKDGQLTGTPHKSTAGKTYRFVVCAVDLRGDFVCREVSIKVEGPGPCAGIVDLLLRSICERRQSATPTPTATPTATSTAGQISQVRLTLGCSGTSRQITNRATQVASAVPSSPTIDQIEETLQAGGTTCAIQGSLTSERTNSTTWRFVLDSDMDANRAELFSLGLEVFVSPQTFGTPFTIGCSIATQSSESRIVIRQQGCAPSVRATGTSDVVPRGTAVVDDYSCGTCTGPRNANPVAGRVRIEIRVEVGPG